MANFFMLASKLAQLKDRKNMADENKMYDEKCRELASYFLQERPDSADAIKGLAQAIQDAVEDWLNGRS